MVYDALSKNLYFSNKLESTLGDYIFAQEYAINMHQTAYEPANCFLIGQTYLVNIHQVLHCRKQEVVENSADWYLTWWMLRTSLKIFSA